MKTELTIWCLLLLFVSFVSCFNSKRAKMEVVHSPKYSTTESPEVLKDISVASPSGIKTEEGFMAGEEMPASPAADGAYDLIEEKSYEGKSSYSAYKFKADGKKYRAERAESDDEAPLFDSGEINMSERSNTWSYANILTAGEVHDFSKWVLWKDISENQLSAFKESWGIKPLERYSVQLTTENGAPVIDALVKLRSSQGVTLWTAKTDNTGKAELWLNAFANNNNDESGKRLSVSIQYRGDSYKIERAGKFHDGINTLKIPAQCDIPSGVDIAFVVDATGSMQDEIDYLKSELNDIIQKVTDSLPQIRLNTASVFYRDEGDEYVTKKSDFSSKVEQTTAFIRDNNAGGGGDFPEAADRALDVAVNEMSWRSDARARLLFLVLDAPPHQDDFSLARVNKAIAAAAEKGIRIIPVTCSGIDKSTEYLMRSLALLTNGTYVFLTDHSGVGNTHIEPTTDTYTVELLNKLLMRLIFQFTHVPPCQKEVTVQRIDTLTVAAPANTTAVFVVPLIIDTTGTSAPKTEPDQFEQFSWRYYPNPTFGIINIEAKDIDVLYITDISGKIIKRLPIDGQPVVKADLTNFATGTYFIKFEYKPDKWMSGRVMLVH